MNLKKIIFLSIFVVVCLVISQKINQYIHQDKIVKILVLFFLFCFFLVSIFFYNNHKKIFRLTFIYFFLILYSLNFLSGFIYYFTSTDYIKKKKFEKLNINYDVRTQLQFIEKNKSKNLYPMITPREIMKSTDNLILSNITNANYVQCNEYGYWKTLKTDKFGFNNNIDKERYEILISGDSFAHGFCVSKDKEIHRILNSKGKSTYSIGMAANGPLLSLASMIEIQNKIYFNQIYWLIFRNDFFDLNWELKNSKLVNYLNEDYYGENYFDNLATKNSLQKKFIIKNLDSKKNFSYSESFFELKFLNDILKKILIKEKILIIDQVKLENIFQVFDNRFSNEKKNIIFLPNYNCFVSEKKLCDDEFEVLKNITKNKNINLVNFLDYIEEEKFEKIFVLGLKRSHYSEHGYAKLANIILELSSE